MEITEEIYDKIYTRYKELRKQYSDLDFVESIILYHMYCEYKEMTLKQAYSLLWQFFDQYKEEI